VSARASLPTARCNLQNKTAVTMAGGKLDFMKGEIVRKITAPLRPCRARPRSRGAVWPAHEWVKGPRKSRRYY